MFCDFFVGAPRAFLKRGDARALNRVRLFGFRANIFERDERAAGCEQIATPRNCPLARRNVPVVMTLNRGDHVKRSHFR